MHKQVDFFFPDGSQSSLGAAEGFTRIVVDGTNDQGSTRRMVFELECGGSRARTTIGGRTQVTARLRSLFGRGVDLLLLADRGAETKLWIGDLDASFLWSIDDADLRSPRVVSSCYAPNSGVLQNGYPFTNLELLRVGGSGRPELAISFAPASGSADAYLALLELRARTRTDCRPFRPGRRHRTSVDDLGGAALEAFGARAAVEDRSILHLTQIPPGDVEQAQQPRDRRDWRIAIEGLPFAWGSSIWNTIAQEYALREGTLDPLGRAFVPELRSGSSATRWGAVYTIHERLGRTGCVAEQAQTVGLCPRADSPGAQPIELVFPRLLDHSGRMIVAKFVISGDGDPHGSLARAREIVEAPGLALRGRPGWSLARHLEDAGADANRPIRFGSLDVRMAGTPRRLTDPHWLPSVHWRMEQRSSSPRRFELADTEVDLLFAVSTVAPGGQDDAIDEPASPCEGATADVAFDCEFRLPRPLTIPVPRSGASTPPLLLRVAKLRRMAPLELTLERPLPALPESREEAEQVSGGRGVEEREAISNQVCGPAPSAQRVIVVDSDPFLVAQVSFPALDAPVGGPGIVARWSALAGYGAGWRLVSPTERDFCLAFPPSAVGESVEKMKSLPEGELADFRLSPPALLAVRERRETQQSLEVPWNLRRLLGQSTRELPGLQVDHLQYELLYGLSCRFESALRLGEIVAIAGATVGPLIPRPRWSPKVGGRPTSEALAAYERARGRWARHRRAMERRLGVYELWDPSRLGAIDLKEGVTCWIRDHLPPQREGESPPQRPEDLVGVPRAELASPFAEPGDENEGKLKGGVTYGFESRNVYNAVMQPGLTSKNQETWPSSTAAEVADLRFSALGGYGHQTASFDFGRSKIIADVAMGRAFSYILERIGRIGVLWNRAKHVIVYERTVVPSRQFAGGQFLHSGRAVLRKVEEYVEILQTDRPYPDDRGVDQPGEVEESRRRMGFVTRSCFAKDPAQVVRFRVRSDWGTDVGEVGWKVPLWSPNAEPADLYPKPLPDLGVWASVEGAREERRSTISNPENLYFYTDTSMPDPADLVKGMDPSDPDSWSAVEGVDFVSQPRPVPRADPSFQRGELAQSLSGDSLVPPGFGPCTFLLNSAQHAIDLAANRQDEPLGSKLASLTFGRARPSESTGLAASVKSFEEGLAMIFSKWRREIDSNLLGFSPGKLRAAIENSCADLREQAAELQDRIDESQTNTKSALTGLADAADAQIKRAAEHLLNELVYDPARKGHGILDRTLVGAVRALEAVDPSTWKQTLKDEVDREVDQLQVLLDARLPCPSFVSETVLRVVREVRAGLDAAEAAAARLEGQISKPVDDLFGRGAELERDTSRYLVVLEELLTRIDAATDSARRAAVELEQSGRKVSVGVPCSGLVRGALEGTRKAMEQVLPRSLQRAREAQRLLRQYKDRYKELLDTSSMVCERIKKNLVESLAWRTQLDEARKALDEMAGQLLPFEAELASKRGEWIDELTAILTAGIDAILAALPDPKTTIPFPSELMQPWLTAIIDAKATLMVELDALSAKIRLTKPPSGSWQDLVEQPVSLGLDSKIAEFCTQVLAGLDELEAAVGPHSEAAKAWLAEAQRSVVDEIGRVVREALQLDSCVAQAAGKKADDLLRVVRAFGAPPEVPGLKFERPELAFAYDELDKKIGITPVIARAAQVSAIADSLKPLGIDLPVTDLAERLLPASLPNFDLSSIFPNIAGVPLQNLFGGLKMPGGAAEGIRVTHGVDLQTKRAWVRVDADTKLGGDATMFSVGPLTVLVKQPRFTALAKMEVDENGGVRRKVEGRLIGDWQLVVGGFDVITFRDTGLEFDENGRIDFKVDPKRVELAEVLAFVNDLLSQISPGGLTIRFDADGVVASLDLPIPDTQLGAFGFASLTLSASMALRFGGGFNIGVTAGLARRDAPFTLTIFILGGGGYFELGSRYFPATGRTDATMDLAIAASASLAIALGPIRGGVAVYVGVTAQYSTGQAGGLTVGILFMVRGHVSVLCIASATVVLRLDAQYAGGSLVGIGSVDIEIRICWCFELKVHESVRYLLAGSGDAQAWIGGPRALAQIAGVGPQAIEAALASPAANEASLNTDEIDELIRRVGDYISMLL